MKPAKAIMSFFPVILPSSSTYIDTLKCKSRCLWVIKRDGCTRLRAGAVADTYLSDLDLDGSVVLGGDESVSGRALSGDVEIHNMSFVVLHLYYF